MTKQEKAEKFAAMAPALNQKELEEVNDLFPAYIFRRSRTRELWTSCCHRHEVLPGSKQWSKEQRAVMMEEHQREKRSCYDNFHPQLTPCPYCGKLAVVKELGRTGSRGNLSCWRRAVVLRWYRGALWARAYEGKKHYGGKYSLTGEPECELVGVYRFKPGLAEATIRWSWNRFSSVSIQEGPLEKGRWNIPNPFSANAEYGTGYDVIGLVELAKSPFRYCMAEAYEDNFGDLIKYLTACCFYPRQLEMLMKAGMKDVAHDLVSRGVKNAYAMDWNETDPRKAFGLNGQEMRDFLDTDRNIQTLEIYKRLKRVAPLAEVAGWVEKGIYGLETIREARKWGLPPVKLIRYLSRESDGRHMGSYLRYWKDYLDAAEKLGYQLHRENVLLPQNLNEAHDRTTQKHRDKLEEEREKSRREEARLAIREYKKRKAKLEEKYGFAWNGYVVRIPENKEEIIEEGRKLQHCVAGYADRHVQGTVTILFLRKEKKPNKPWLTIEMRGNQLVQIHGYRNEGAYTSRGRFAPGPREEHREFLDIWLAWIGAGSKRNKDGTPKLPKKIKNKEVNVA